MKNTNRNVWLLLGILVAAASAPATAQSWSFTGSMNQARNYFTATLLSNGEVLVVGGSYRGTFVQYGLTSAELYNPSTATFSYTGSLNTGRYTHTATLLTNGQVLIAGGENNTTLLSSAELYDPSTGKFSVTGSMHSVRGTAATLLNNGKVLFAGGYDGTNYLASAELYDPFEWNLRHDRKLAQPARWTYGNPVEQRTGPDRRRREQRRRPRGCRTV